MRGKQMMGEVRTSDWSGWPRHYSAFPTAPPPTARPMRVITSLPLLVLANFASAHGDHGHGSPADGETMQDYARRHVRISLKSRYSHAHGSSMLDGLGTSYVYTLVKPIISKLTHCS
jgi:hypothetical protein